MRWVIAALLALALVACGDSNGDQAVSQEELATALLAQEDMPAGWSIGPEGSDDTEIIVQFCQAESLEDQLQADAQAERDFTAGETGPYVGQLLGALTEDDAKNVMDYVREAFGCAEWTDAQDGATWLMSEISFPDLGDETEAYHFSSDAGDASVNGNAVVVREGGVILAIVHIALGELDVELTEELARTALDKVEEI